MIFEWGTSRAETKILNLPTYMFFFHFLNFLIFNFLIYLSKKWQFQNNFPFSYPIIYNPGPFEKVQFTFQKSSGIHFWVSDPSPHHQIIFSGQFSLEKFKFLSYGVCFLHAKKYYYYNNFSHSIRSNKRCFDTKII